MDANDRIAIEDLFARLGEAERRLPQRDPEAEALIRSEIARHPAAPYYMAQTIVVQQAALENARRRIEELEERGNGGLFGGDTSRRAQANRRYDAAGGPWDNRGDNRGGGGFLAGAAQTAVGVAGGVLLGNMLAGALFGGGDANAGESPPDDGGDAGDAGDFDAGDMGDF